MGHPSESPHTRLPTIDQGQSSTGSEADPFTCPKAHETLYSHSKMYADSLAPEFAIFGHSIDGQVETLVSSIADAVPLDANNRIEAVVDGNATSR
jgi:hypothetical protein